LPTIATTLQQPVIRVSALEGQRGEQVLFTGLGFDLAAGEVLWLRGANGRGKTTLLRLLAGLASPTSGEILGADPAAPYGGSGWRAGLAYIAHANGLKDDLTAAEALAFVAGLGGRTPSAAELDAALAALGVAGSARALVRTLSQGQRRRVALARLALPGAPRLWLLDEPFDALDDAGIAALNGLLAAHAAAGGAALLTSHQPLSLQAPLPRVLNLDASAVPR